MLGKLTGLFSRLELGKKSDRERAQVGHEITLPKLPLESLRAGTIALESMMLKSLSQSVTTLQISTRDEMWCTAHIMEIPRTSADSELEALVMLVTRRLYWLEEWEITETRVEDFEGFADLWLTPLFRESELVAVSGAKARDLINGSLESVRECALERANHAWASELHINGQKAGLSRIEEMPGSPVLCGLFLSSKWNSVDVFYVTPETYGIYDWGTGA
ncbi:hypothetical protein [Lysobacter sp. Root690]|uniref:hypothetical protein n=1 Tax=Lysobacter sp. Root690 TaxID=1736588 RepID=UPI000700CB63|nr:hypothetical protein [Lysobacter sp. Root690]KRB02338.1 hypothetical protein ASD86_22555 [Lysobacter sp. Root690]